jgi:hypothetical protein
MKSRLALLIFIVALSSVAATLASADELLASGPQSPMRSSEVQRLRTLFVPVQQRTCDGSSCNTAKDQCDNGCRTRPTAEYNSCATNCCFTYRACLNQHFCDTSNTTCTP